MMIKFDTEKCIGCGSCVVDCVSSKIELRDKKAVLNDNRCLECGHCVAVCPTKAVMMEGTDQSEIIEYDEKTFAIPPENLLNFIRFRRSIRSFLPKQVEQEKIEMILKAAAYSPTGGNRRVLRYVVMDNKAVIDKMTEKSLLSLDTFARTATPEEAKAAVGTSIFYLDKWKDIYEKYKSKGADGLFHKAPLVICIIGTDYDRLDAGIAAGSMEMMVSAQKLGACYIGFFGRSTDFDEGLKADLGIKAGEKVMTTLAIGYTSRKYYRTINRTGFQKVVKL